MAWKQKAAQTEKARNLNGVAIAACVELVGPINRSGWYLWRYGIERLEVVE